MAAVPRKGIVYCEDGEDDVTVDIHALLAKRARGCKEGIINSKQPTDVWVLLLRVYFLNENRTRYFSVGFYQSDNYQVLVEFKGAGIVPIRLTEHHARTLMEALPEFCDAMQCGELYTRKDGAFRIRCSKTHNCARLYHGKQCFSFKLVVLHYMLTMVHMVEALQCPYILAQADVMSYAYGVLGSLVFVEPQRSGESPIQYDQLIAELKLRLI